MLPGQLAFVLPDAPPPAGRFPAEPITRWAHKVGDCRWELRRAWGRGPLIAWCGLNPSEADGHRDDPTMWREIGFSFRWGFGGLTKVNRWPFVTPDTAELRRRVAAGPDPVQMRRNLDAVLRAIDDAELVVAAWGRGLAGPAAAAWCAEIEAELGRPVAWACLGTNADGSPRHTLSRGRNRVPDDFQPVPWRP